MPKTSDQIYMKCGPQAQNAMDAMMKKGFTPSEMTMAGLMLAQMAMDLTYVMDDEVPDHRLAVELAEKITNFTADEGDKQPLETRVVISALCTGCAGILVTAMIKGSEEDEAEQRQQRPNNIIQMFEALMRQEGEE